MRLADIEALKKDPRFQALPPDRQRVILAKAEAKRRAALPKLEPAREGAPAFDISPAQALERVTGIMGRATPTTEEQPIGDKDIAALARGGTIAAAPAAIPALASLSIPALIASLGLGYGGSRLLKGPGRELGEKVGLPETGEMLGETGGFVAGGMAGGMGTGIAENLLAKRGAAAAAGPLQLPLFEGGAPAAVPRPAPAAGGAPAGGRLQAAINALRGLVPETEAVGWELAGRKLGKMTGVPGAVLYGGRLGRLMQRAFAGLKGAKGATEAAAEAAAESLHPTTGPGGKLPGGITEEEISALMAKLGIPRERALELASRPGASVFGGKKPSGPTPSERPLQGETRAAEGPAPREPRRPLKVSKKEKEIRDQIGNIDRRIAVRDRRLRQLGLRGKPERRVGPRRGGEMGENWRSPEAGPVTPAGKEDFFDTWQAAIEGRKFGAIRGIQRKMDAPLNAANEEEARALAAKAIEALNAKSPALAKRVAKAAGLEVPGAAPKVPRGPSPKAVAPAAAAKPAGVKSIKGTPKGWTAEASERTGTISIRGPQGERIAGKIEGDALAVKTIGKGKAESSRSVVSTIRSFAKARGLNKIRMSSGQAELTPDAQAWRTRMIERGDARYVNSVFEVSTTPGGFKPAIGPKTKPPHPSHLRDPYDTSGPPQPVEESLGTLDPKERTARLEWLNGYTRKLGLGPASELRTPNKNMMWSPSVSKGNPYPEWSRSDWQQHVKDVLADNIKLGLAKPKIAPLKRDYTHNPYEDMSNKEELEHVAFGDKPAFLADDNLHNAEFIKFAKEHGLPYEVSDGTLMVGKDAASLGRLKSAKTSSELGRALGYPDTAKVRSNLAEETYWYNRYADANNRARMGISPTDEAKFAARERAGAKPPPWLGDKIRSWGPKKPSPIKSAPLSKESVAGRFAATKEKPTGPKIEDFLPTEKNPATGRTRLPVRPGTPITRTPIESSAFRSWGYDAKTKILEVEHLNGDVYRYHDVPPMEIPKIKAAKSKGAALGQVARKYPGTRQGTTGKEVLIPRKAEGTIGPYEEMTPTQQMDHVLKGDKPAMLHDDSGTVIDQLAARAKRAGLPYEIRWAKKGTRVGKGRYGTIYIGKNRAKLDALTGAMTDEDIGKALGYTAKDLAAYAKHAANLRDSGETKIFKDLLAGKYKPGDRLPNGEKFLGFDEGGSPMVEAAPSKVLDQDLAGATPKPRGKGYGEKK